MELAPGVWTRPGLRPTSRRLDFMRLPDDLSSKTVLDVGAWDGFYSFESERRGASRVVAADHFVWGEFTQAGFLLAREALGSRVEAADIDVPDICPDRLGTFDLVLFLGVLYHLKNPMDGIERVASVTREHLILETLIDLRAGNRRPLIAFYPGDEIQNDDSNWCGPNPCAVEAMLRVAGFSRIEMHYDDTGPRPHEYASSDYWHRCLIRMSGGRLPRPIDNAERWWRRRRMRHQGFARLVAHAWK